jgi:hypothetical protein
MMRVSECSSWPLPRYLQGFEEEVGHVEVLEDDLDWTGGQRIAASVGGGRWVLKSVSSGKSTVLFVQAPGMEKPALLRGQAYEEGRKVGERARTGTARA